MKKLLKLTAALCLGVGPTAAVIACVNNDDSFKVFKEIDIANSSNNKTQTNPIDSTFVNNFHVNTPQKSGMLNDIQGAFYRDGIWHVYFLYNWEAKYDQDGNQIGGNGTEWYHVETRDWINWDYKGIAVEKWNDWGDAASGSIYEDVDGDFGAVVNGTSKEEAKGGYVTFTTAYGGDRGQNIMAYYSPKENYGYDFELIQKDPILQNNQPLGTFPDFRDPFVFKKDNKFIMYVAQGTFFGIYESSEPLGEYKKVGEYKPLHGMIECGSLFQLNVNGDDDEKKWVFIYGGNGNNDNGTPSEADGLGTGTYYSIGHLNADNVFIEEQAPKRLDFGADFYAAKFWKDPTSTASEFDHLIGTGWMSSWDYNTKVPNNGKWGNMSLAREIRLTKNSNGVFNLKSNFKGFDDQEITSEGNWSDIKNADLIGQNYKLSLTFENIQNVDNMTDLIFADDNYEVKFRLDYKNGLIYSKRSTTYQPLVDNKGFTQIRQYKVNLDKLKSTTVDFIVDNTTIEAVMPDGSTISVAKYPDGTSNESLLLQTSTDISFSYKYYQL